MNIDDQMRRFKTQAAIGASFGLGFTVLSVFCGLEFILLGLGFYMGTIASLFDLRSSPNGARFFENRGLEAVFAFSLVSTCLAWSDAKQSHSLFDCMAFGAYFVLSFVTVFIRVYGMSKFVDRIINRA
jgi:hypothetical protein